LKALDIHQTAILVLWLWFLSGCSPASSSTDMSATPVTPNTPSPDTVSFSTSSPVFVLSINATQTTAPKAVITAREQKEEQESPKYAIIINYPFLETDSPSNTFNETIHEYLEQQKSDFLQTANDNEAWRFANMPQVGNTMQINYTITYKSSNLISIMFTKDIYIAGAAHPNIWAASFNYDLDSDRILSLFDLFSPSTPFLETISDYCIHKLMEQQILQMPSGAQPEEENYIRWNITIDGIQITFDPYQVAPYAAGMPQVLVPYENLRPIINSDSPVWSVIQSTN